MNFPQEALSTYLCMKPHSDPFESFAVKLYTGDYNHCAMHLNDCREAIFPCNVKNRHWIMIRLDLEKEVVHIYDSMNTPGIKNIVGYIAEAMPKLRNLLATTHLSGDSADKKWEIQTHKDVPRQGAGTGDCGVFVLKWIEYYIFGKSLHDIVVNDPLKLRRDISAVIYACGCKK